MKVQITELKTLSDMLFKHLETSGQGSFDLQSDYYWEVPKEQRYDSYDDPKDHSMGQLSDDWGELQKILRGEKEPVGSDLIWLSTILRKIGEETTG